MYQCKSVWIQQQIKTVLQLCNNYTRRIWTPYWNWGFSVDNEIKRNCNWEHSSPNIPNTQSVIDQGQKHLRNIVFGKYADKNIRKQMFDTGLEVMRAEIKSKVKTWKLYNIKEQSIHRSNYGLENVHKYTLFCVLRYKCPIRSGAT